MTRYLPYRLNIERCFNLLRKAGKLKATKKDRDLNGVREAMSFVYTNHPEIMNTLEPSFHAEEYFWANRSRVAYFLENLDLAEGLMRGSYKIHDPMTLIGGDTDSFMLMLPKGLKVASDFPVEGGLLVSIMPLEYRQKILFGDFFKWMGLGEPEVSIPDGMMQDFTIAINYQVDPTLFAYSRLVLPSSNFSKVIGINSPAEYAEFMNSQNQMEGMEGYVPLTEKECEAQFYLFKLVCGFLVYRQCMPDRIVEGFPAGLNRFETMTPVTSSTVPLVVSGPKDDRKETSGKVSHYRSWYFRQLMDDRYYKGEHSAKPKGSRVVFVRDTYIGADIEPETVVE